MAPPDESFLSSPLYSALKTSGRVLIYAPDRLAESVLSEVQRDFPKRSVKKFSPDGIVDFNRGETVLVGSHVLVHPWALEADCLAAVGIDKQFQAPDFRSAERAFQLLKKLATHVRSGGRMIVQTSEPSHPAVVSLIGSLETFYRPELQERRQLRLPPVVRQTRITFSDRAIAERAGAGLTHAGITFTVSPARGKWQILVTGDPKRLTGHLARDWQVDVDPQGPV